MQRLGHWTLGHSPGHHGGRHSAAPHGRRVRAHGEPDVAIIYIYCINVEYFPHPAVSPGPSSALSRVWSRKSEGKTRTWVAAAGSLAMAAASSVFSLRVTRLARVCPPCNTQLARLTLAAASDLDIGEDVSPDRRVAQEAALWPAEGEAELQRPGTQVRGSLLLLLLRRSVARPQPALDSEAGGSRAQDTFSKCSGGCKAK